MQVQVSEVWWCLDPIGGVRLVDSDTGMEVPLD